MFINALSWKKFNSNKNKKANEGSSKHKGLPFRTPLDNIHPVVDNNKNIQNALCHGSKSTSLVDSRRSLDIVRTAGSVGSGTKTFSHPVPPQNPPSQHQTATTNANVLQNSKVCNINNNNNTVPSLQQTATDQTDNYQNNVKKKINDNDDLLKKQGNNNVIKTEQLPKPGPKKTVIQVRNCYIKDKKQQYNIPINCRPAHPSC